MIGKKRIIKKYLLKYQFQNQTFDIIVKDSRGKSLVLKLDSKKNIIILKPFFISFNECQKFLDQHFYKIYEDLKKRKQNQKCNFTEKWCYLWGEKYEIIFHPDVKDFIIKKPYILLNKKNPLLNWKKLKKVMYLKIINQAKQILQEENLLAKITIKNLSRTWGICHKQKKQISLSARLIHFAPEIVRYVIYHEVTHLFYPNHGVLFKNFLKAKVPNYKSLKKELINW